LDENLQITLTSLARYSLALEIQMSIPKPLKKIKKNLKKNCHFFLLIYTPETMQNAGFCVNIFKKKPNKTRSLTLCLRASQNSGGLVQIFS